MLFDFKIGEDSIFDLSTLRDFLNLLGDVRKIREYRVSTKGERVFKFSVYIRDEYIPFVYTYLDPLYHIFLDCVKYKYAEPYIDKPKSNKSGIGINPLIPNTYELDKPMNDFASVQSHVNWFVHKDLIPPKNVQDVLLAGMLLEVFYGNAETRTIQYVLENPDGSPSIAMLKSWVEDGCKPESIKLPKNNELGSVFINNALIRIDCIDKEKFKQLTGYSITNILREYFLIKYNSEQPYRPPISVPLLNDCDEPAFCRINPLYNGTDYTRYTEDVIDWLLENNHIDEAEFSDNVIISFNELDNTDNNVVHPRVFIGDYYVDLAYGIEDKLFEFKRGEVKS